MPRSLFPFIAEDGKMGFKDLNGNIRIPAIWDEVKSFGYKAGFLSSVSGDETGLARVKQGVKWGLINETGDCILPCEYDKISFINYSDVVYYELAVYDRSERDRVGLADISGKILIPPCEGHLRGIYGDIAVFTRYNDKGQPVVTRLRNIKTFQDLPDIPYVLLDELYCVNLVSFGEGRNIGIMDSLGNKITAGDFFPGGLYSYGVKDGFVSFKSVSGPEFLLDLESLAIFDLDDFWKELFAKDQIRILMGFGWRPFQKDGETRFKNRDGAEFPISLHSRWEAFTAKALELILRSGWLPILSNGKAGLSDQNGKTLLDARYESIDVYVIPDAPHAETGVFKCKSDDTDDYFAIHKGGLYKFPSTDFTVRFAHDYYSKGCYFAHKYIDGSWSFFPYGKYRGVDLISAEYEALREGVFPYRNARFACVLKDSSAVEILSANGEFVCGFPYDPEAGNDFCMIGDDVIAQYFFSAEKVSRCFDLQGKELTKSEFSGYRKQVSVDGDLRAFSRYTRSGCLTDMAGNALTERFDFISKFYYNRAYVKLKTRSGVINIDGNYIVPLTSKLKWITTFEKGYAECRIKTKEGYVEGVIDLWGGIKVL